MIFYYRSVVSESGPATPICEAILTRKAPPLLDARTTERSDMSDEGQRQLPSERMLDKDEFINAMANGEYNSVVSIMLRNLDKEGLVQLHQDHDTDDEQEEKHRVQTILGQAIAILAIEWNVSVDEVLQSINREAKYVENYMNQQMGMRYENGWRGNAGGVDVDIGGLRELAQNLSEDRPVDDEDTST